MKFVLADSTKIKQMVHILSNISAELNFHPEDTRVLIAGIDPSKTLAFHFEILMDSCVEFEMDDAEPFAVNSNELKAVLKRADNKQVLRFETTESKLHINLKDSEDYDFWLPLKDYESVPETDDDLKNTVLLDAKLFEKMIVNTTIFADSLTIRAESEDEIHFGDQEEANARATITSSTDNVIIQKLYPGEISRYASEMLKNIASTAKVIDKCKMQFATRKPLITEFEIPEKLKITWTLAPRIEE